MKIVKIMKSKTINIKLINMKVFNLCISFSKPTIF